MRRQNLVYVTGLRLNTSDPQLGEKLRGDQFFGQYGRIDKIVVNRPKDSRALQPVGVYITFFEKEAAALCIDLVNNSSNAGGTVRFARDRHNLELRTLTISGLITEQPNTALPSYATRYAPTRTALFCTRLAMIMRASLAKAYLHSMPSRRKKSNRHCHRKRSLCHNSRYLNLTTSLLFPSLCSGPTVAKEQQAISMLTFLPCLLRLPGTDLPASVDARV